MTDQELLTAGTYAQTRGQCVAVIVGTNEQGERGFHLCNVTVMQAMHGHKTHHCDCGESWRYLVGDERWSAVGPLTDVVFS